MKTAVFKGILGQELALRGLEGILATGQLRQSLLFEGPLGVGKQLVASRFAAAIAKRPDIHYLAPEGKTAQHSIDAMRSLAQRVQLRGFDKSPCVFIIEEAHRMPLPAANALLKTFEEPPERVVILLLTSSPSELLATVRSRCLPIPFSPMKRKHLVDILTEHRVEFTHGDELEGLLDYGRAGFALRYFQTSASERVKLMLSLLKFPLKFSDFRSRVDMLDREVTKYSDETCRRAQQFAAGQEVVASIREHNLRVAQSQVQLHVQEEFQYFVATLLNLANRGQLRGVKPWSEIPLEQFAADFQKAQLLLQRGGRLGQLLEFHWLTWRLIDA